MTNWSACEANFPEYEILLGDIVRTMADAPFSSGLTCSCANAADDFDVMIPESWPDF